TSGKTATQFGAHDLITRGELAVWIQKGFELKGSSDVKFTDVAKQYKEAVSALVDNKITNGINETQFGTDQNAKRGDFAIFLKRAYDAKNHVVVAPALESVDAINTKTIKVSFNKEIDPSKAQFVVKKGTTKVNVAKTVVADDHQSVQLVLSGTLTAGEYTVDVTGLTDKTLSGSVKVENEKVDKIEVLSEYAPVADHKYWDEYVATVGYRVLNQYGEDITSSDLAKDIEWTTAKGSKVADNNKGTLYIKSYDGFKIGDKVVLTGVNKATSTVGTKTVTISEIAAAKTVEFNGIYNEAGKEFDSTYSAKDYTLLFSLTDQYGNAMKKLKDAEDIVFISSNPSLIDVDGVQAGQGANQDQLGLKFKAGENYSKGGTATITAVSKSFGTTFTFDVNVKAEATLDTFTLLEPTDIVVKGETVKIPFKAVDQYGNVLTKYKDLKGKVRFLDSENNVPDYPDHNMDTPTLKEDNNGNAYLEYTASETGNHVISATVISTDKVSTIQINVKEAAYAATVDSVKDLNTNLAVGATEEIGLENLVIKDQYGRTFDLKNGDYKVVVKEENKDGGSISVSDDEITSNNTVTVSADAKGTEDLVISIIDKNGKEISTSPLNVTFNVLDKTDFKSYEVAPMNSMYLGAELLDKNLGESKYAKTVDVYGITANGTKVMLPKDKDWYTVIPAKFEGATSILGSKPILAYQNGKLYPSFETVEIGEAFLDAYLQQGKKEITTSIKVVIDGNGNTPTINQDVVISLVAPTAKKVEVNSDSLVDGSAYVLGSTLNSQSSDVATLATVLDAEDQYGVVMDLSKKELAKDVSVTVTNIHDANKGEKNSTDFTVKNNGTPGLDISGAERGDKFTATFVVGNQSVQAQFTVNETPSANIKYSINKTDGGFSKTEKVELKFEKPTETGTVTVSVKGIDYTVFVTKEDSASDVAEKVFKEIAKADVLTHWIVKSEKDTVVFTAAVPNKNVEDLIVTVK
ncbi:MAG: S-layer homology domain-containing protein, partial [Bacillus sp. (in: firmicutes)]